MGFKALLLDGFPRIFLEISRKGQTGNSNQARGNWSAVNRVVIYELGMDNAKWPARWLLSVEERGAVSEYPFDGTEERHIHDREGY